MRHLAIVLVLVLATTAAARPVVADSGVPAPQAPAKKTSTAMLLTLGTIVGGTVLVVGGGTLGAGCTGNCNRAFDGVAIVGGAALLVGPSLGHIYADDTWNTGFAVRLGGLGAFGVGALLCLEASNSPQCTAGVATLAGLVVLGGSIYEIATTPRAVAAYNREHAAVAVSVAPIRTPTGVAPGLALVGRF